MAIGMGDNAVRNILRSGGNSFVVSGMGSQPAPRPVRDKPPVAVKSVHEEPSVPESAGAAKGADRRERAVGSRRIATTVTVDGDSAKWLREERIRRRIAGGDEPWSCSGILGQALAISLDIADKGGRVEEFSCGGGSSGFERFCLNMDLATWLRMEEIIDRYRSEGAAPEQLRFSCFVRKGLDILRNR